MANIYREGGGTNHSNKSRAKDETEVRGWGLKGQKMNLFGFEMGKKHNLRYYCAWILKWVGYHYIQIYFIHLIRLPDPALLTADIDLASCFTRPCELTAKTLLHADPYLCCLPDRSIPPDLFSIAVRLSRLLLVYLDCCSSISCCPDLSIFRPAWPRPWRQKTSDEDRVCFAIQELRTGNLGYYILMHGSI